MCTMCTMCKICQLLFTTRKILVLVKVIADWRLASMRNFIVRLFAFALSWRTQMCNDNDNFYFILEFNFTLQRINVLEVVSVYTYSPVAQDSNMSDYGWTSTTLIFSGWSFVADWGPLLHSCLSLLEHVWTVYIIKICRFCRIVAYSHRGTEKNVNFQPVIRWWTKSFSLSLLRFLNLFLSSK